MREDEFLERVNLILQSHEVGDCLVAFVGIVDGLQTDVFLILEQTVELRVLSVKPQFGKEEEDVFSYKWSVSSQALAGHTSCKTFNPIDVLLRLFDSYRMAFLQHLVDSDQRLERLHFVCHDRLHLHAGPEG